MSNIGNIIKDKRLSQNLSLDELGELINVGKSTISKWENGTITDLKLSNIISLCRVFDMTPNELLKINPSDKNYLAYGGEHISTKKENLLKQIAEKNIPDAILDLIQNAIEQYN